MKGAPMKQIFLQVLHTGNKYMLHYCKYKNWCVWQKWRVIVETESGVNVTLLNKIIDKLQT